jgi:glycosyltransferase involved in cell wall biosynthesis
MLVTAIITTFNRPTLVRRAIKSVVAQTYKPLEVIVVDDCSEVGLEGWLRSERVDRVQYVRHQENLGLAASRNTGLRLAGGKYVAFLDDDDEWKNCFIARLVEQFAALPSEELERVGVAYCGTEVRRPGKSKFAIAMPQNNGNLREAIVRDGARTLSSTALFSRDALEVVGAFDETLPSSIDHDIWMSLATHGYYAHSLNEPLAIIYRSPSGRMTTDTALRIRGVRMYAEKWQPTYEVWFGKEAGTAYAQRYFARVVGILAATQVVHGKLADGWQAIRAIFEYGGQPGYKVYTLAKYIVWFAAQRVLPPSITDRLLALRRTIGIKV